MENLCKSVSSMDLSTGLKEVQITIRSFLSAQDADIIRVNKVISKITERNRIISFMLETLLRVLKNVDNSIKYT